MVLMKERKKERKKERNKERNKERKARKLKARNLERSRFDLARGKREKAREACDLLLLLIYCHIPPGRGLEVRTLEVIHEAELSEPFVAARFHNRNVALMQKDGGLTIHVQKYKTYQCGGKDTIPIQVS